MGRLGLLCGVAVVMSTPTAAGVTSEKPQPTVKPGSSQTVVCKFVNTTGSRIWANKSAKRVLSGRETLRHWMKNIEQQLRQPTGTPDPSQH